MTGYGRATVERDGRQLTVELKSVNHRFLDIACRLPKSLLFLEDPIRRQLAEHFSRGHFDVFVTYANTRADASSVRIDMDLARSICSAGNALSGWRSVTVNVPRPARMEATLANRAAKRSEIRARR